MIKTFHSRATVGIVAFLFVFLTSCVQEEYRISEETLNLEVTVFQEGLALPLGSTDAVKVSQLVDQLDPEVKEMFQTVDGAYAFNMSDKFDFSEQLAFLSENFSIEKFSLNENMPFDLAEVDLSGVSVSEKDFPFEQVLSDVIKSVELEIDPIRPQPISKSTDISSYNPTKEALIVNIQDYDHSGNIITLNPVNNLSTYKGILESQGIWSTEYPIGEIADKLPSQIAGDFKLDINDSFEIPETDPIKVPFKIVLPSGIKEVKDVQLSENAKVKITVSLTDNLFFTSGDITPHLDLDVHDIFHLTDEENAKHPLHKDHMEDDFILNKGEHYNASHEYIIKSLILNYNIREKDDDPAKGDFYVEDDHLVLDKTIEVHPALSLTYDLYTTLEELSKHTEAVAVEMFLKVEFTDFVVDNVAVVVEPFKTEISTSIDIDIEEQLPDLVNGVNKVEFTDGSGIDIEIDVDNIDRINGLDCAIDEIVLTFPAGLEVVDANDDNVLTIPVGSLDDNGFTKHVEVTAVNIDKSNREPGILKFSDKVTVSANGTIGVKDNEAINTSDLPTDPKDNISLSVAAEANFGVRNFVVDFAGYYYDVEKTEPFDFPVPAEVAEFGSVKIVPKAADGGEPVITIDIELPESNLEFATSSEGLTIDLPDMIKFKDINSSLDFTHGTNVLKINGALPEKIELPIDYIIAEAKKIEGTDEYQVSGELKVTGKVGVAPGVVTKADMDALTAPGAKVSFKAHVPELVPDVVDITTYQKDIPQEEIDFGGDIDLSVLPEQLVAVGEILLKDVALEVNVSAAGIGDVLKDADVTLDMAITLPEAIMVEEGRVDANGVLKVTGTLEGDEICIEPIDIIGLCINKSAEELADYMSGLKIVYGGNISVSNASIDLEALKDKDIALDIDVTLATKGSEMIEIAGVTGKVDYQVEPIKMDVELGSLLESLNSENLSTTLDLNRFSLALDLKTNLSVPLVADLSLVPYKGDAVIEGETLTEHLVINMPEASSEPSLIRFWISNYPKGEDKYMPFGYEHVSLDLIGMLSLNPDKVELVLNAGTDPTQLASVVPTEDGYILEAEYAFNLPFEFGEDTRIEFRQVIEDLPSEIGEILQYASLALTGEVESTLPLGLDMTFNFLDSEGNVIEMLEDAGKQAIKPGTASGEAVKTDLNILVGVKKDADISDISAIELVFTATSVPGAPIKEDSYIKATLQALIPEGVTLDLAKFMGKEDEEN